MPHRTDSAVFAGLERARARKEPVAGALWSRPGAALSRHGKDPANHGP
ncbi:hypothetical protein ACFV2N_08780 [Streptomyces sp. NPDC059680]